MTHQWAAAAVLGLAVAAGCGEATSGNDVSGGDEPTTARALAWVATQHVGEPESARREEDAAEELGRGAVGAELRFGSGGEYDGDMLVVAVGEGLDPGLLDCGSEAVEGLAGCEETDRGTLLWEAAAPEEDPGVVYVAVPKGEATVLLFYAGPPITGDPRDLDLPIPVDTLLDLAGDPRVDVTTSREAIEGGNGLSSWQDG